MIDDLLLEQARRLWAGLAGTPVAFREAAVEVVVSPRSALCPPGWVGIVALGGAAIVTVPHDDLAETVRRAFDDPPTAAVTDPAAVRDALPVAHALRSGRLPQWRARPEASRRVARALGFRELGSQLSILHRLGR